MSENQASPSPASLAAALERQSPLPNQEEVENRIAREFSGLAEVLEKAGLSVHEAVSSWMRSDPLEKIAFWSLPNGNPGLIVEDLVRGFREERTKSLLGSLIREWHLSFRPRDLGPYFRQYRTKYSVALVRVRYHVGIQFLRRATAELRDFTASKNAELSCLDYACRYLSQHLKSVQADGNTPRPIDLQSFGNSIVHRNRFERVATADLAFAVSSLLAAVEDENTRSRSLELLIEALAMQYDLTGDRSALSRAVAVARTYSLGVPTQELELNLAEVWIKLAGESSSEGRSKFLSNAEDLLDRAGRGWEQDRITTLRIAVLRSVIAHSAQWADLTAQGLKTPFSVGRGRSVVPPIIERISHLLAADLFALAQRGEYLNRDVCADFYSIAAKTAAVDRDSRKYLERAIALRDASKTYRALPGDRHRAKQAMDRLALAAITGDIATRRAGLAALISDAFERGSPIEPLTVIARDVREHGAFPGAGMTAPSTPNPIVAGVLRSINTGNAREIYRLAAERTVSSKEVDRRSIGGRGGVSLYEDRAGHTGETLVFKEMAKVRLAQDAKTTAEIQRVLIDRKLTHRFGLIEHLSEINLPSIERADGSRARDPRVLSVRRFENGLTLLDYSKQSSRESLLQVLVDTAEFLAVSHSRPVESDATQRRVLRDREFGRWLRSLAMDEAPGASLRDELFDKWWLEVLRLGPLVPRVDAHALNWIVQSDGRVLAVDLDSPGSRPLGYELAQLMYDQPLLNPDDMEARGRVLQSYLGSLQLASGEFIDRPEECLELGEVARAAFTLTDPEADEERLMHATRLLDRLSKRASNDVAKEIAERMMTEWGKRTGILRAVILSPKTVRDRRRVSRAMSYHLRHNSSSRRDRDGWIESEELARLLVEESGIQVGPDELLLVAGALGESRFEILGSKIRAIYGHSVEVEIERADRTPPSSVYHGTARSNLESIFEARDGLRPMKRRAVHLTTNPAVAMAAAGRRKESTVLVRVSTEGLASLEGANDSTWLVPRVPVENLQLVPIWDEAFTTPV